jgi:protein ImuA
MEECLRERAIGLVCAEIDTLGLAASRRLQLAAAAGGTTGLLLRGDAGAPPPTASVTRWRVVAAPAFDFTVPRWRVELLRARNGRPRHWLLEWRHDSDLPAPDASRPGERPAAGFSLAAPLRDRPDLPAPLPRAGEDRQRAA